MLESIGILFVFGLVFSLFFERLSLPSLMGMILLGIAVGPYGLKLLDQGLLDISADLRQVALVLILTRAGLSLDIRDIKKLGISSLLMSFLPALIEILAFTIFAPLIFKISYLDGAIMGAVMAAVSPAVVVPRFIKILDEGYGKEKKIPQLILTGASMDDIFVIVVFYSLLELKTLGSFSIWSLVNIPVSIFLGYLLGKLLSFILVAIFDKIVIKDNLKVILILGLSFLLLAWEKKIDLRLSFSALIAIISIGLNIYQKDKNLAERLAKSYNSLWSGFEIILFVLVGALVNINYLFTYLGKSILLVLIGLSFRMLGVYLSIYSRPYNRKEKIFCMGAYLPKATVQAAIGSIPLAMGLESGEIILAVSVICILLTAPLGAVFIDKTYKKLLDK